MTDIDNGMGYGWQHQWNIRLAMSNSQIVLQQEDGRRERFTVINGILQSDADSQLTLIQDNANSVFTLQHDDGSSERFNKYGLLISQTDVAGRQITFSYNSSSLLQTVTGPFGHALSLTYTPENRLETLTTPNLKVYRYEYDAIGNLVKVIYPDTSFRLYHYEDSSFPHALTGISDENGDRYATFAYASDGRAIVTEHAQIDNSVPQERFTLNYDSATQTTVTDAIGTVVVYTFADNLGVKNLLRKINQTDGKGLQKSYDDHNNVVSITDAENRLTTFEYNTTNQRIAQNEAVGTPEERRTEYDYLSPKLDLVTRIREPSVVAGQVKEIVLVYNPDHTVKTVTEKGFWPDGAPISRSTAFQYNSTGQVTAIDGPRTDVNDITTLTYYECTSGGACGRPASITNALGHTVTYDSYDANGRLTQMTDALGLVTTYSYDSRSRLLDIVETPPAGQGEARTTRYRYDAAGQLQTFTSPAGVVLTYSYDAAHNLRSVSDNNGNRIEYGYDAKGNRIQQDTRDPDGTLAQTVQTEYDLRNRLKTVNVAGSITQFIHNAVGELISTTDANQNPATSHRYDPLGRLKQTLDALGNPTVVQYDGQDRAVQVTAPNNASTQYSYDDLGNLLQESSPDRGVILYQYNEAGEVIGLTDALGITRSYHYDALNRLVSVDFPGTEDDLFYIYDNCPQGIGRLCQSQNGSDSSVYHYDVFGNIIQVDRLVLGVTTSTNYQYNDDDRLTAVIYPNGVRIDYIRNSLGQLTAATMTVSGNATPLLNERRYRSDGHITYSSYGNGLIDQRDYDHQSRLIRFSLSGLLARTYQYDANSNITRITDSIESKNNQSFQYDNLNRLSNADNSDYGVIAYQYDTSHNRISKHSLVNALTINEDYRYAVDSNQIIQKTAGAVFDYQYDANGNITDNGHYQFIYGDDHRLHQVSQNGQVIATYRYNAQGQRTSKTRMTPAGHKTTYYLYSPNGQLLSEINEGQASQLLRLTAQAEQLQQDLNRTITDLQQNDLDQQTHQQLITTLEQQNSQTQNTVNTLQQQASRQQRILNRTQRIVTFLQRWRQYFAGSRWERFIRHWLERYQQRQGSQQAQLDQINTDIAVQQQRIDSNTAKIILAQQQISRLQSQWQNLHRQQQTQQAQLDSLNQQIAQLEQQPQTNQTQYKHYIYANGQLSAIIENKRVYYVHNDHLGTPQVITDQNQQIVWQANYTPFGKATIINQTLENNIRFPGQYFDSETGLHYNYHRYYDPSTGRYISSDPIGLAGGLNTYAYVGGNPINAIDPFGLDEFRLYSVGQRFVVSGRFIPGGTIIGGPLDPAQLAVNGIKVGVALGGPELFTAKRFTDIIGNACKSNATKGGRSVGAMARREYQGAGYHGKVGNSVKSKAPTNGQDALDMSVQVKGTSPRRVGIDYKTGEFAVFDQTSSGVFHGHVRGWNDLTSQMQNALRKSGMVDRKGNILGGGQ